MGLLLGEYSTWLNEQINRAIPHYSFLHKKYDDITLWKKEARLLFEHYIAAPILEIPTVEVLWTTQYENLHIEKLKWALPFGPPTEAYFLKPIDHKGPLRGVLGLHDHGLNKTLGKSKIVRDKEETDKSILSYQHEMYEGQAWANEIAKKGFAVLVHDIFPFESRQILPSHIPLDVISTLVEAKKPEEDEEVWCSRLSQNMESVIAKSIFTSSLTWPGIILAEDRVALNILAHRDDVDASRIGCCGLSLGGLRAAYLAGSSNMIKSAVIAGFMTTWNDFILHKAHTHTWMYVVPGLGKMMNFSDIVSMMAPSPLLVLSCIDDELFTLSEVKKAEHNVRAVYEKAGFGNNFEHNYHKGSHRFSTDMQMEAFDWFDSYL